MPSDLLRDVLTDMLSKEGVQVQITTMDQLFIRRLNRRAFRTLNQVKSILENEALSDAACIEEIAILLENMGCTVKGRHQL